MEQEESDPLIGQVLGSYHVESLVGIGGMGRVYRGIHETLGRAVAIKLLPSSLAEDSDYIQRFLREAQIAGQLNHPNLIGCYDFGESDYGYYFVMEFVRGKSLADHLIESRKMKVEELIPIVQQVCDGLSYAHAAGIVHRDIKPDNILVTEGGSVKVADLGLAKLDDNPDSGLTQAGMALGTPNYISPEQVRGEQHIDLRADIYSLGATMFHCVTGRIPYQGNTPSMIMTRHVNDPVPIARQSNPDVPENFSNLLLRMMQKSPQMRPANCEEVREELQKILDSSAGRIAVAHTAVVPLQDTSSREGLFWLLCGSMLLAGSILGGGYLVYRRQHVVEAPIVAEPVKPAPSSGVPPTAAIPPKPPPEAVSLPPEPPPVASVTPPSLPPSPPPEKPLPQTITVRGPGLLQVSQFVGSEAEVVQLSSSPQPTLNSLQHIFLQVNYAGILSQMEQRLGYVPEYTGFHARLSAVRVVALEGQLAVRVFKLTGNPVEMFQFDRNPIQEVELKPSDHPTEMDVDLTSDLNAFLKNRQNYGVTLMTSQGGEASFATQEIPDEKLWPVVDVSFMPRLPQRQPGEH